MRKVDYVKNKYYFSITEDSIIINGGCPSNFGLPDTSDEEKCKEHNCLSCWCEPVPKSMAEFVISKGQKGVMV